MLTFSTCKPSLAAGGLFSHNKWYRLCRMRYEESSYTNDHRDMESKWRELFEGSPSARYRPADGEALGGPRETTLGLRPMAGDQASFYSSQTSSESAARGGCRTDTKVEGDDRLLPGEAGRLSAGGGYRGIGVDHTPLLTQSGTGPSQHEETEAQVPERACHASQ